MYRKTENKNNKKEFLNGYEKGLLNIISWIWGGGGKQIRYPESCYDNIIIKSVLFSHIFQKLHFFKTKLLLWMKWSWERVTVK